MATIFAVNGGEEDAVRSPRGGLMIVVMPFRTGDALKMNPKYIG